MGTKNMSMMWFIFEAVCWTLWLNRNDFVFNNLLIYSPHGIIFRLISFLQHWMIEVREGGRSALELVIEAIGARVPLELTVTEVGYTTRKIIYGNTQVFLW
jgi:hypothetical protein